MPQLNRLWSPPFQPAPHRHAIRCFLPRFSVLSLSATLSCLCGSLPQHPSTGAPFQPGLRGQMGEDRKGFTPSLLLAVTCCLQTVTCGHQPCPSSADQLSARASHLAPVPHLVMHPAGSTARPRHGWGIPAARKEALSPGRLTKSLLLFREPPSEVPEDSRVAAGFWRWSHLIRED